MVVPCLRLGLSEAARGNSVCPASCWSAACAFQTSSQDVEIRTTLFSGGRGRGCWCVFRPRAHHAAR
eukprot:4750133-Pyramimonas_sp.AAC.1